MKMTLPAEPTQLKTFYLVVMIQKKRLHNGAKRAEVRLLHGRDAGGTPGGMIFCSFFRFRRGGAGPTPATGTMKVADEFFGPQDTPASCTVR